MSVLRSAAVLGAVLADAELMRRVTDDDAEAFALLYDRHATKAYRLARTVCDRPSAAEEAVQEAFISIWRSRLTYEHRAEGFAAWAMTIVRHRAIDITRRDSTHERRRGGDAASEVRAADVDVAAEAVAGEEGRHLRRLLAALPDEQREVITLAFYGELSHSEIAAHLGLPPGTVKGRMRLGLQKLNGSLG